METTIAPTMSAVGTALTGGIGTMIISVMAIVAVVIVSGLVIFGAKYAIKTGVSFFRTLGK